MRPGKKRQLHQNQTKIVTNGGLTGYWDIKKRKVTLELPNGITSVKCFLESVDGVYNVDFTTFECSASFIDWTDYDYPCGSKHYLISKENARLGRQQPPASSQDYPRMKDISRYENPTRPAFLKGGQRNLRGRSYSPSEVRFNEKISNNSDGNRRDKWETRDKPVVRFVRAGSLSPSRIVAARNRSFSPIEPRLRNTPKMGSRSKKRSKSRSPSTKGNRHPTELNALVKPIDLPFTIAMNNELFPPFDGEEDLGPCLVNPAELHFIRIISHNIHNRVGFDRFVISLRMDLARVDAFTATWESYCEALEYLLIEWFVRGPQVSRKEKLDRLAMAFSTLHLQSWYRGIREEHWKEDDITRDAVSRKDVPYVHVFIHRISALIKHRVQFGKIVHLLTIDRSKVRKLTQFWHECFQPVVYYTLSNWFRDKLVKSRLSHVLDLLSEAFEDCDLKRDFADIRNENYAYSYKYGYKSPSLEPKQKRQRTQSPMRQVPEEEALPTPPPPPHPTSPIDIPGPSTAGPSTTYQVYKPSPHPSNPHCTPFTDRIPMNTDRLTEAELTFLKDLAKEIGMYSTLMSLSISLLHDHRKADQEMVNWPHDLYWVALTVFADWYYEYDGTFSEKLDLLQVAFEEASLTGAFQEIHNRHIKDMTIANRQIRAEIMLDEWLEGTHWEPVHNSIEAIPTNHLKLLYQLQSEIHDLGELLTICGALGVDPEVIIPLIHDDNETFKHRTAHVILKWFANADMTPHAKYLRLKFGFTQANRMSVFNNALSEHTRNFLPGTLPVPGEYLFPPFDCTGICGAYDIGKTKRNEWEEVFVSTLCGLVYYNSCLEALIPLLNPPNSMAESAEKVHVGNGEENRRVVHFISEWFTYMNLTLTDKITRLQCAYVTLGMHKGFQTLMSMYGRFLYFFSNSTSERTPPASPVGAQGHPGVNGEDVDNYEDAVDLVEVHDITHSDNEEDMSPQLGVQVKQKDKLKALPVVKLIRIPRK